jgi:hypothetical protein
MSELHSTSEASGEKKLQNPFSFSDDDSNRQPLAVVKPSLPARVWRSIVGFSKEVVGQLLSPQFWVGLIKNALRDAVSAILYSFGGRFLQTSAETGDPRFKRQTQPSAPQPSAYPHVPHGGPSAGFNNGFAAAPTYRGNEFTQPAPSSPNRPNTPGNWRQ